MRLNRLLIAAAVLPFWVMAQPQSVLDAAAARARFVDGYTALQSGRAEEAAALFREGLRLKPDSADGYFYLGEALKQLPGGRGLAEAEAAYRRSAELSRGGSTGSRAEHALSELHLAAERAQRERERATREASERAASERAREALAREAAERKAVEVAAIQRSIERLLETGGVYSGTVTSVKEQEDGHCKWTRTTSREVRLVQRTDTQVDVAYETRVRLEAQGRYPVWYLKEKGMDTSNYRNFSCKLTDDEAFLHTQVRFGGVATITPAGGGRVLLKETWCTGYCSEDKRVVQQADRTMIFELKGEDLEARFGDAGKPIRLRPGIMN